MSVFNEFQKLWAQKFPNSTLSSALEADIKDSLIRHKEKIKQLSEELEQEKLYCKYLEKLLSDVERNKTESDNIPTETETANLNSENPNEISAIAKKSENDETELNYNDEVNLRRCVSELHEISKCEDGQSSSDSKDKSSQFVTVIEVKEAQNSTTVGEKASIDATKENIQETPIKKPEVRRYENVIIETKKDNVRLENDDATKSFTSTFTGGSVLATAALFTSNANDIKKKIPPRPPPKFAGKRAPATPTLPPNVTSSRNSSEIKSNSLDRYLKPSEMLRQKSSESLAGGPIAAARTTVGDSKKLSRSVELTDDLPNMVKSDIHESANSMGSGNLDQSSDDFIQNGSLDKLKSRFSDASSKESLGSNEIISERMKSYESVSSLNSDGLIKANTSQEEPIVEHVVNKLNTSIPLQSGKQTSQEPLDTIDDQNLTKSNLQPPESPGHNSNYVNIEYFLNKNKFDPRSSIGSDVEANGNSQVIPNTSSHDTSLSPSIVKRNSQSRNTTIRQIISSIINSETLYVECLNKMRQYMKAIKASLCQTNPVLSQEDYDTIFFKIDDLYAVHEDFLTELRTKQSQDSDICVGEAFNKLTNHIDMYSAFLHNYGRAIETVKKCGVNNSQFRDIVSKIVVNAPNEQSLTLEDLLHKPVARVQKNALNIQDLLNHTPETHPDYIFLKQAQVKIRSFLAEFNVPTLKIMEDKTLRRLIKNSFIVELAEGHRKLRHLFLFNDVIVCAKYKASGRDQFEFELKWFIPVQDILVCEESVADPKEINPVNIIQLRSQACTVRDQLLLEEKEERKKLGEKHKKKLADLEAQLVLASPNLVFKLSNKINGKMMTFFLSSEFERTQWIDSILSLQQSCNLPGVQVINVLDIQAWIAACKSLIKTEMGSYLLRSGRDESLLIGDLHLNIQHLTGLDQPSDLFICIEVDSYGHYFRKAKTKLACKTTRPVWDESFVIELEGSQNLRILVYQDVPQRPQLKAKHILTLSRNWLSEEVTHKLVKVTEQLTLSMTLKFIPGEITLRRVPTSKPGALFGSKLQSVLKREKRDIPFIINACIREVERRGISEVGIYRVSGSASDLAKLKKAFETNAYEAEQLLKEVDIHSVTGILKSYLRELPEALFTDILYQKLFDTFNKYSNVPENQRIEVLTKLFIELPRANQITINLIIDHLLKVNEHEGENKMSLHNLAMVLGPTLLRPGKSVAAKQPKDFLEASTVDVMAQAGILYCFLCSRSQSR